LCNLWYNIINFPINFLVIKRGGFSSIPSISTKQPIIPHLNKLNTPKKITAYDIGNLGPGVGHVQLCAGVKPVNGIPTLPWDQPSPLDN
jgi:hypothetical protein